MKFGIAMLFNAKDEADWITANKAAHTHGAQQITLAAEHNRPHVTLLQGALQSHNVPSPQTLLENIKTATSNHDLSLTFSGASYHKGGWYFAEFTKTPGIEARHNAVLETMLPLLHITSDMHKRNLSAYTTDEQQNFLKYGYRYIGKDYRPHVTLGRTEAKDTATGHAQLMNHIERQFQDRTFTPAALTLYTPGPSGEHKATQAQIEL